MISTLITGRRLTIGGTMISFLILTGCQGEKIVARVGSDPIKESDFYGRSIRMTGESIPKDMDAGGAAMVGMIREKMTDQLAAAKNAVPTEEQVSRYLAYQMRVSSPLKTAIDKGLATEEEIKRGIRYTLEEVGIGTEGAKVADTETRAEYSRLVKEKSFVPDPLNPSQEMRNETKLPEMWYLRTLTVPDEATGKKVIEGLRIKPDLGVAATGLGANPQQAQQIMVETPVAREKLAQQLPVLEKELQTVSAGQYTQKPIQVTMRNPQDPPNAPPRTSFLVVQFVRKEPAYDFKYEEVQPVLELRLLSIKHKDWIAHKEQEMAKFTEDLVKKDGIKINLKQYQSLLDTFIKQMATQHLPGAPGGTMSSPTATPPPSTPPPASNPGAAPR